MAGRWTRLRTRFLAVVASAVAASALSAGTAQAATVTVAPDNPQDVTNCLPFGIGGDEMGTHWTPFAAFIYQNVPSFELQTGDALAFDLGGINDADIELDIALARTVSNGSVVQDGAGFTQVVNNIQTPQNPRGDTTVGNYELRFAAQAPFSFPGGGLIIRFSDPSPSYEADNFCDPVLGGAGSSDTSGFFVRRAFGDSDGQAPWDPVAPPSDFTGNIAAFQVVTTDPPPNPQPPPGGGAPSISLSFGKVKKNKRKGTAKLTAEVPGPGELDLAKTKKVKADDEPAEEAGKEKLSIKPKGKANKKLNKKGKAKVKAEVTYTPEGGEPNTQSEKIKLVKR